MFLADESDADCYCLREHLYSLGALVDTSGNVVEGCKYDAYGEAVMRNTQYEIRNMRYELRACMEIAACLAGEDLVYLRLAH